MSCNRENVVWESPDGTWNLGFFEVYVYGDDHEWDVDYNYDRFEWFSGGHASSKDAITSWRGSNPGMHRIYPSYKELDDDSRKYVDTLEQMASPYRNR